MKTIQLFLHEIKPIIKDFVKSLDKRFSSIMCEKAIAILIEDKFEEAYRPYEERQMNTDAESLAYKAAVYVFEHVIENNCRVIMNGHHVAQDFAKLFKEYSFE